MTVLISICLNLFDAFGIHKKSHPVGDISLTTSDKA
jgi:hypothetical protein